MKYKIGQDFEYVGNDYWQWWAWIEARDEDLDRITQVVWILHPTFRKPRVVSTDRAQKFLLKTAGWGTFRLRAEIELSDGENVSVSKNLKLEYPEEDQADAEAAQRAPSKEDVATLASADLLASVPQPRFSIEPGFPGDALPAATSPEPVHAEALPAFDSKGEPVRGRMHGKKVFLSYGSEDAELVVPLRRALLDDGVQVLDVSEAASGASWQDEVNRLIARSDMVIGVVGHDYASPFVAAELGRARGDAKPVCVVTDKHEQPFGLPADVARIPIDMRNADFKDVVAYVSEWENDAGLLAE